MGFSAMRGMVDDYLRFEISEVRQVEAGGVAREDAEARREK